MKRARIISQLEQLGFDKFPRSPGIISLRVCTENDSEEMGEGDSEEKVRRKQRCQGTTICAFHAYYLLESTKEKVDEITNQKDQKQVELETSTKRLFPRFVRQI